MMKEPVLEESCQETEKEAERLEEEETVNALTAYFRRTSRGRIVELPRWAQ